MVETGDNREERILILAPTGRDASLTARYLMEAGFRAERCGSIDELCEKVREEGAGMIFLTGEALTFDGISCLVESLKQQPAWSDIPVVVLTSGGGGTPVNVETLAAISEAGNVTLIERPVRVMTLLSAIRSALRARRRQYDVRDRLAEEKRAKDALSQSEQRLRIALDAGQLGAWQLDLVTKRFECTARCKANFGLPPEAELTYDRFMEIIHPDDRDRVRAEIKRSLAERDLYQAEYRVIWSDRSRHWIAASGRANFGADGEPFKMVGITLDITERKRAELNTRFLLEINETLGRLSNTDEIMRVTGEKIGEFFAVAHCAFVELDKSADVAVIHYDRLGDDETVSLAGTYRMAEYVSTEFQQTLVAGLPLVINDVASDGRTVEAAESFQNLKIGSLLNTPYVSDGVLKFALGLYRQEAYPWREDEIVLMRELTARIWTSIERRRIEEERERLLVQEQEAREQAVTANRLKDEFLATVSHELRTPLTSILGWSRMLNAGKLDEKNAARALETIERNAKLQAQLIEDILDVSRIITGKLRLEVQSVDLAAVIESALDGVLPAAQAKNIRLQKVLDTGASMISGDPGRLQQIVWNLLSNAIKFTPKAGRVQIRLERINSHVEITVTDTGQGISAEVLPYIFERFRQADSTSTRQHGGLGLGLAIVRHLVEMHGGTVEAESRGIGQGATFILKFPLVVMRTHDSHSSKGAGGVHPSVRNNSSHNGAATSDCPPELDGLNVLVCDDEEDTRLLVTVVLERCGASVTSVASAQEAMAALQHSRPDILISDIGMPGEDGYSLIKKVRSLSIEDGGKIPAAALTAYARMEDRMKALRSGFQIHLPKPVEPAELVTVVANLAGRFGENNRERV